MAVFQAADDVAGVAAGYMDADIRVLAVDLSAEITRAVAGKTIRQIRIGTVYPATTGVLPAFLAKIARK
ncbi:hypothetical protein ACCS72_38620, partial [Rhizobium ruizarguesonis]